MGFPDWKLAGSALAYCVLVENCPAQIKESAIYADRDWWATKSLITTDGQYVLFEFDDGIRHLWHLDTTKWSLISP